MTMHVLTKVKQPFNFFTESVIDLDAVNFWLQKINPLWSSNKALGKIVQKDTAADDMVSVMIQINRNFKFGQAGQHHPVFVAVNGIRYERTYSLTRLNAQHVLLTVKKVNAGIVSTWFSEQAEVGQLVEFGLPYGEMTVPKTASPLVLLAAGSGITPMLSLIKEMSKTQQLKEQPVKLMYWVKNKSDAAFLARFENIASHYANFSFHVFYTQALPADARVNASHAALVTDLANSIVYACGPSGFTAAAEEHFAAAQNVQTEAFSMSALVNDDIGFVNVTLLQTNKVVSIPKGVPILAALEQQNIKPKHGCRMGICNKCACNKAEGATKNLVNGAQNTERGNLLKLCVSSAQTDLVIDL